MALVIMLALVGCSESCGQCGNSGAEHKVYVPTEQMLCDDCFYSGAAAVGQMGGNALGGLVPSGQTGTCAMCGKTEVSVSSLTYQGENDWFCDDCYPIIEALYGYTEVQGAENADYSDAYTTTGPEYDYGNYCLECGTPIAAGDYFCDDCLYC